MENLQLLKTIACDTIDKNADGLFKLSHDIWSQPELSYEERFAHKTLTEFLEINQFPVERHYGGLETAFRTTVGEGRPHVAVLCEYDALPEIGHACGHNLIAEVGVAAGLGIRAAMEHTGNTIGKLTVLGTPAEEKPSGKVDLMRFGAFDDIDVALMAHPFPKTTSNVSANALDGCEVVFKGKASHAASYPWEGINALDAAVMAYSNISCLRQQLQPFWRVHGVITNGGTRPNIIPELASMHYMLRAPNSREMDNLKGKLACCFEAAAQATGCKVEINWYEKPLQNCINNAVLRRLHDSNAKSIGVDIEEENSEIPASTDFGNVSNIVPGLHPLFDIGHPAPNHTREYTANAGSEKAQPYTLNQAKSLAMTALDVMCQPEVLEEVKRCFQNETQNF